jgi:4-diphosphocytidyl-2-C-methyl-D-erythritol kinase
VILFSPAKINLGLHILKKRGDGFHDISTLMYPIPFRDILEINPSAEKGFTMTHSGIPVPGNTKDNLCYRAWELFCSKHRIIPVSLHLHKRIPPGAGLGGGSSNAATMLRGLNTLCGEPFSIKEMEEMAAALGSDCSLFIRNAPALAEGRGEILKATPVKLQGKYLILLYPELHIDTASAYRDAEPFADRPPLDVLLDSPAETWQQQVRNDFEKTVFRKYPEIGELKSELSAAGAFFASMSGSGSAVFGLFHTRPLPGSIPFKYITWEGYL